LSGCGVGFSIQKHHIAQLPKLAAPEVNAEREFIYKVPDTIEGWADSFGVLLSSYFVENQPFPDAFGKRIEFEYDLIRPAGSKISNTNGKAPGYKPLEIAIEKIRSILDKSAEYGRLRTIDAYDMVMHASDCVLSGGVRRSATIALFSPDDEDMLNAKTGDWLYSNPQRARSNNSAVLLRKDTNKKFFKDVIGRIKDTGEPGFVFVDDLEIGVNPCCEIGLYAKDDKGQSGFAFCNLSEINAVKCKTAEDFYNAAKAASILGTFQATYTKFDYLGEISQNIVEKEALLGVNTFELATAPSERRFVATVSIKLGYLLIPTIGVLR
jgi:ribonucleoside-diphosphate reductase alpha chain